MKKTTITALVTSLILICANHYAHADADSSIRLDASLSYDDNLNRSPVDRHAIDSAFATLNAGYNFNYRINKFSFMDYHLSTKYESYQDTSGLNNAQLSTGLSYKIKPYPGFTRATYSIKADIQVADFETDIRDRTAYETTLDISFWMTNRVSIRSGLNARIHDSDSRVFDTKNYRLFLSTDFLLSRRSTLYSSLNLITGDLVSTVPLADSGDYILDVIRQADAIESDPTFDDNMVAYRINADIATLSLGYNYIVAKKQSLDISARYAIGKADYNVAYSSVFFNISYLLSFGL